MGIVALAQVLAAVATGLLAFLTFRYVRATEEMVRANREMVMEMRQTNERMNEPNVQVILEPGKRHGSLFELAVRNTGNVSLYDVHLEIDPKDTPSLTGGTLGDLNLFRIPIPVLTEMQEVRTILLNYRSVLSFAESDGQSYTVTFTVTYRTLQGQTKSQIYAYDLNLYKDLTDFSEASLNDVVKQVKDLNKQTKAVSAATQKVSDRLEWNMRLPRGSNLRGDLRTSLARFLIAWQDFQSLDDRAFIGFNLHTMLALCEETYDELCSHSNMGEEYAELRRKLLGMSRARFYLGSDPVEEFTSLGNEAEQIIRGLDT